MKTWSDLAEIVTQRAQTLLWTPAGAQALDYLRGRCFVDEWIQRAELGFIPKYTEWNGLRIPPGISIPSRTDGIITQIRVRIPKPAPRKSKYMSVSGGKLTHSLWGIDQIDPNKGVIIFEGEFNALSALQMGFNAVATTSATNKLDQPAHMQKLLTVPWLMSWFDDDLAGDTARANLLRCDYHIICFDDLNGLVMYDKRFGTDYAREWLENQLFFVEDELPPQKRYLDDSTLERFRAERAELEVAIWGDGFVSSFMDNLVAAGILDASQLVSLYEQPVTTAKPTPEGKQSTFKLSPDAIIIDRPQPAEVEQQTLFALPTVNHYTYGL